MDAAWTPVRGVCEKRARSCDKFRTESSISRGVILGESSPDRYAGRYVGVLCVFAICSGRRRYWDLTSALLLSQVSREVERERERVLDLLLWYPTPLLLPVRFLSRLDSLDSDLLNGMPIIYIDTLRLGVKNQGIPLSSWQPMSDRIHLMMSIYVKRVGSSWSIYICWAYRCTD